MHTLSEPRPGSHESRSAQRTNLFVTAVLHSEGKGSPARIRNLSASGALIDASNLPPAGTPVRLCRGSLHVAGKIVWARGGKAGLTFISHINVAEWLPDNVRRHQARVDEMVQQVRAGAAPAAVGAATAALATPPAAELSKLASLIESVAEALAADPHVIKEHSWKLQQLETAIQSIRRLSKERQPS